MSRQRSDPNEMAANFGPLFNMPAKHLSGATDPATSKKAAAKIVSSDALARAQAVALAFVRNNPGSTAKELGRAALSAFGGGHDVEFYRQKIGRRLNELEKCGLVHRDGERDSCALWWPGPWEVRL